MKNCTDLGYKVGDTFMYQSAGRINAGIVNDGAIVCLKEDDAVDAWNMRNAA